MSTVTGWSARAGGGLESHVAKTRLAPMIEAIEAPIKRFVGSVMTPPEWRVDRFSLCAQVTVLRPSFRPFPTFADVYPKARENTPLTTDVKRHERLSVKQ